MAKYTTDRNIYFKKHTNKYLYSASRSILQLPDLAASLSYKKDPKNQRLIRQLICHLNTIFQGRGVGLGHFNCGDPLVCVEDNGDKVFTIFLSFSQSSPAVASDTCIQKVPFLPGPAPKKPTFDLSKRPFSFSIYVKQFLNQNLSWIGSQNTSVS